MKKSWRGNRETGRASLLYAYSLGKAQRILSGVDAGAGPIYAHGAVAKMNDAYRRAGVQVAKTLAITNEKRDWSDALIIAPPSAMNTPWARRFGDASRAFASGWMTIRGMKRRRNVDRGFALSDHADWPSLLRAIAAVDPEEVWLTHGYAAELARFLVERGIDAREIETRFTGEKLEELEQDDA